MKKTVIDNTKLGIFVVAGILFLVFSLYMIGRNRNLFGSTITISADFYNVDGLTPGNNVRFGGIDVGTVKKVEIMNDTSIHVTMIIDKKAKQFIKKNAVASIGTDGLMGNKLININSSTGQSELIENGSRIWSRRPIETDEMLRTLNTTNDNIAVITYNLKSITQKLNSNNSLWTLLADTLLPWDVKQTVTDVRKAGRNIAYMTSDARDLVQNLQDGEGVAGALLSDTVSAARLRNAIAEIQKASEQTAIISRDVKELIEKVKQGHGTAGQIFQDTLLIERLNQSMVNIQEGTYRFNENMEALKHNFLFRGYFKKQEKKKKTSQQPPPLKE